MGGNSTCGYIEIEHMFIVFKQKTAYEVRISDWSSDVCSSDLHTGHVVGGIAGQRLHVDHLVGRDAEFLHHLGRADAAVLHRVEHADARFISRRGAHQLHQVLVGGDDADLHAGLMGDPRIGDRKSTRLNSVTNAQLVCRLLLEKKNTHQRYTYLEEHN